MRVIQLKTGRYLTEWQWATLDESLSRQEIQEIFEEKGKDVAAIIQHDNLVNIGYGLQADHSSFRKTPLLALEILKRIESLPFVGVYDLKEQGFYVLFLTSDFAIFTETDRTYESLREASFILDHLGSIDAPVQTQEDLEKLLSLPITKSGKKIKIKFVTQQTDAWWTNTPALAGLTLIVSIPVLLWSFGFFHKYHKSNQAFLHQVMPHFVPPPPPPPAPPPPEVDWLPPLTLIHACQTLTQSVPVLHLGWQAKSTQCTVEKNKISAIIKYQIHDRATALPWDKNMPDCEHPEQGCSVEETWSGDLSLATLHDPANFSLKDFEKMIFWHHWNNQISFDETSNTLIVHHAYNLAQSDILTLQSQLHATEVDRNNQDSSLGWVVHLHQN